MKFLNCRVTGPNFWTKFSVWKPQKCFKKINITVKAKDSSFHWESKTVDRNIINYYFWSIAFLPNEIKCNIFQLKLHNSNQNVIGNGCYDVIKKFGI